MVLFYYYYYLGSTYLYEEYFDYIFPDDEKVQTTKLKIFESAQKWKKRKLENENEKIKNDDNEIIKNENDKNDNLQEIIENDDDEILNDE
jgi:hypothetical protein